MSPAQCESKRSQIDGRSRRARGRRPSSKSRARTASTSRTLCHWTASPTSAPAVCAWSKSGENKLLPACVTRVAEGMEVTTNSERLASYRRMILELLFAERNHVCSVCVSNGHCELQTWRSGSG